MADKLREVVAGNNYFLDFGLLGSKTVPAMLTKYGYIEDAMKMITKTEAPSWGYWVETMGYSTLPETWTLSPKFADASLNHVFMGDVSAWMMNQLAGINQELVAISDQISTTEMQVEITNGEIQRTKDSLADAQAKEAQQYNDMKTRIKYMYETGSASLTGNALFCRGYD